MKDLAQIRRDAEKEKPWDLKELMKMEKNVIKAYFSYMDATIEAKLFLAQIKGKYFDPSELESTSKKIINFLTNSLC